MSTSMSDTQAESQSEDNYYNELDEFSNKIAETFDITKFAADMIHYVLTRSWYKNEIIHSIIKADTIPNFDFCSFMRGDHQEELMKYNVKNFPGEHIPDYRKVLLDL